jgi:hypothetical protein
MSLTDIGMAAVIFMVTAICVIGIIALIMEILARRDGGRPYGPWVSELGQLISQDYNLGLPRKLWQVYIGRNRSVRVLEVTNHTPEPGGGYKVYWLGVPGRVNTVREAVAWTFGIAPHRYEETVRT